MEKKSTNKIIVIATVSILAFLVLIVIVAGIVGSGNKKSSDSTAGVQQSSSADESTLVKKVKSSIDAMSEDARNEMLTNHDGVSGSVVNVNEGSSEIVKVKVSTPISQLATNDEGKDIATKVLVAVCRDAPGLRGIDLSSDKADSKSNIVLSQNLPTCKNAE